MTIDSVKTMRKKGGDDILIMMLMMTKMGIVVRKVDMVDIKKLQK